MFLSASQLKIVFPVYKHNDESHCKRAWWNKYIKKLPVPQKSFTNLGSVLHSCIENYLRSEDLDDGEPFPEGWDKDLREDEADLVKTLVTKGIEEGHINKEPKRKVEMSIWDGKDHIDLLRGLKPQWEEEFLLEKAKECWEIVPGILLNGFIDYYFEDNKIIDWKSSSNPHKWGLTVDKKSTKYIGFDLQLLIYADFLRQVKKIKGPIEAGHVYFRTKSTPEVTPISHTFTPEVLDEFHEWLTKEAIPDMVKLKNMTQGVVATIEPGKNACGNYGGCPYKELCAGNRTEKEYLIIQAINNGDSKMTGPSLADILKAKKNKEAPVEAPVEAKVTKEVTKAAPKKVKETKEAPVEVKVTEEVPVEAKVEVVLRPLADLKKEIPEKKKRRGYTLCINCQPIRGCKPVSFHRLFNEITSDIVEEMGKESWYDLDPFKRRDLFPLNEESILDYADGKTIVVKYIEPDYKMLIEILKENAKTIMEGMAN